MILATINRPVAIRQELLAGNDWTGVAPSLLGAPLLPSFADDTFKFAAGDLGGLFDPTASFFSFESREAVDLIGVELKLGGQNSWQVIRVDADGNQVVVFSGKNETDIVVTVETKITLLWGEKLTLVTVNASAPLVATLKFCPTTWVQSSYR